MIRYHRDGARVRTRLSAVKQQQIGGGGMSTPPNRSGNSVASDRDGRTTITTSPHRKRSSSCDARVSSGKVMLGDAQARELWRHADQPPDDAVDDRQHDGLSLQTAADPARRGRHPVSFGSPGTLIKMPRKALRLCYESVDRLFRLNHATRLKQFIAASDLGRLQVRRRRASLRESAAFPELLVVQVQKSSTESAGRKDSFSGTTFSRE